MQIDKALNLVIPVYPADTDVAIPSFYVHATAISRQVFETYFMVIAKTFSTIYNSGLGPVAGPRVAMLTLEKIAKDEGMWEGATGVEAGLFNEIRRLANVIRPGDKGWTTIPFQEAVDTKAINDDDRSEVENILVFFTVVSSMHRRAELPIVLDLVSKLWGAERVSLNSTGFAASLKTSTVIADSTEKAKVLSIPS